MAGYPGTSFPTALDTLNQIGPGGGSVQPPNSQGETHSGLHAQLAAALAAVQTVIGITGSVDTSSIMYRLGQLGGTAGLGQGANIVSPPYTIQSSDRGYVVAAGTSGTITIPSASSLGAGFVVAVSAFYGLGSGALTISGASQTFCTPSGSLLSSLSLRAGESVILMARSGNIWLVVGATGSNAQAVAFIPTTVALTDQATITTDASLGNEFAVTLAASRIMAAPTSPSNNQTIEYIITQGGAGSNLITWNAIFGVGTTVSALPTLSTAVGKRDRVVFKYSSAAVQWDLLAYALGF